MTTAVIVPPGADKARSGRVLLEERIHATVADGDDLDEEQLANLGCHTKAAP